MKTLHSIIFLCLSLASLAQTPFNDFNPINDTIVINEVTVTGLTGTTSLKTNPIPVTLIAPEAIQRTTSSNIIDAIAQWPGLSQITTGNGISKPVIRGLGYNRIVVVNGGIRQEGQQFYQTMFMAQGKTIVPQEVYNRVFACVRALKDSHATPESFKDKDPFG